MKISVQVKTKSKVESVEQDENNLYIVRVHVPPIEGRANQRVIELLAEHFNIPKSSLTLVSGHRGRLKVFEIPD